MPRVIQDLWIVCDDMSPPKDEIVHSTYLQYSVKKRAKEMARYQGAIKLNWKEELIDRISIRNQTAC